MLCCDGAETSGNHREIKSFSKSKSKTHLAASAPSYAYMVGYILGGSWTTED